MARTRGPWVNDGIYPHEGSTIVNRHGASSVERIAIVLKPENANVIAAAPELLTALEAMVRQMAMWPGEKNPEMFDCQKAARAAIAKAKVV